MVPRLDIERGSLGLETHDGEVDQEHYRNMRNMMIMAFLLIVGIEFLVVFVLICVFPNKRTKRERSKPAKTMIVLGSGGHTAEMLKLVTSLDKARYSPRVYVVADTDSMSGKKAMELEKGFQPDGKQKDCDLYAIPRSRHVGQSYFTSIFTTLRSMLYGAAMVWQLKPDVLIINGPGTCIPLALAAFVYKRMYLHACDIVYVESIARVKRLSLSAKILYHLRLADVLVVQWEALAKRYPRATYAGRVY